MPIVEIKLSPGREPEKIATLLAEVTETTSRILGVPSQRVRILLHEIPDAHWSNGGVTLAEENAQRLAGEA